MNTTYLQYFLAIVQHGSINKAANALYLNYSSLNYAINELEKEIGSPVFIRNRNGVELTEVGKIVAQEAQAILDTIAGWSRNINSPNNTFLRIDAVPCIYYSYLDDIICKLSCDFPHIRITSNILYSFFTERSSNDMCIYLAGYTTGEAVKKNLFLKKYGYIEIPIFKSKYGFYVNNNDPLAKQEFAQSEEIIKRVILTNSHPSVSTTSFFSLFDEDKIIYLPSQPQIFDLIIQNKGTTILPMHLYSFPHLVNTEKISVLPIVGYDDYITVSIFFLPQIAKNTVIQQVINYLTKYPFTEVAGAEKVE